MKNSNETNSDYTRLSKIMTKAHYKQIVSDAITYAKAELDAGPEIPMNNSVYNQLIAIKKEVIDEGKIYSEDEADERYSLGLMAIRNYDGYEGFAYKDMLVDISYGISLYPTMS